MKLEGWRRISVGDRRSTIMTSGANKAKSMVVDALHACLQYINKTRKAS